MSLVLWTTLHASECAQVNSYVDRALLWNENHHTLIYKFGLQLLHNHVRIDEVNVAGRWQKKGCKRYPHLSVKYTDECAFVSRHGIRMQLIYHEYILKCIYFVKRAVSASNCRSRNGPPAVVDKIRKNIQNWAQCGTIQILRRHQTFLWALPWNIHAEPIEYGVHFSLPFCFLFSFFYVQNLISIQFAAVYWLIW